jgi:hypothetical protein
LLGPFTDYDPIVNAMALCCAANSPNVSAIVMSPVNIATLAVLSEVPTGQYLRKPTVMQNVPILITTGMDNNQVILGDFSRLIIGIRT